MTDHDVLVNIADLLTRELAELQHMRNTLERLGTSAESGEERLPSIAVEDMSKGDPKIVSKSYGDRPLTRGLIDEHLEAHAYAHRRAAELAMNAWQETVDAFAEARNGNG